MFSKDEEYRWSDQDPVEAAKNKAFEDFFASLELTNHANVLL